MRRSPFSANGCTHASGASTGRGGGGGGAKEKRLWSNNSLVGKKYNIYTTGLRYVVRGKRTTDEKQHETKPVSERVYYKNDERVRVGKKRKRIRCARDRVGTSENNEVCNAAAARIPRARNTNKRILYIITSLSSSYRRRSSIYIWSYYNNRYATMTAAMMMFEMGQRGLILVCVVFYLCTSRLRRIICKFI